jgi:acid phosphatase
MGARVTLERLSCSEYDEPFVRTRINDGIISLPFCKSGPGGSCPLGQFMEHVRQRREEVGDFATKCGLEEDAGHITFLHQN